MIVTLHYNKVASKIKNKVQWSVHFKKRCIIVDKLKVDIKLWSHTNKRQPYAVLKGNAKNVKIKNGTAHVY